MARSEAPPTWQKILGTAGGMVLGAVLLVAAWAKILDPSAFADQIRLEGLDFLLPAAAVAVIALGLEIGLGSLLLLGVRRLWVLGPSAALVAFFLWLTGRNYWLTSQGLRDPSESCGCFGNLVQRTPAEAFWQDVFLLVPPLLLAFLARRWGSTPFFQGRVAVATVLTVAGLLVAWKAPELPLDNLATRLKPGVQPANLCIGEGDGRVCLTTVVPELEQGRHLVVLAELDDPAFRSGVEALSAEVLAGERRVWVLASAEAQEQQAFFWELAPRFEIRETPAPLMRPLYRTLPRSFVVEDGTVKETYSGLPPSIEASGAAGEPEAPA